MAALILPFTIPGNATGLRHLICLARGPQSRWRAALRMWQQHGLLVSETPVRDLGKRLLCLADAHPHPAGRGRERLAQLGGMLLDGALPTAMPDDLGGQEDLRGQYAADRPATEICLGQWEDATVELASVAVVRPPWREPVEALLAAAARGALCVEIVDRYCVQPNRRTGKALKRFLAFAKRERVQAVDMYFRLCDNGFPSAGEALDWIRTMNCGQRADPPLKLRLIGAPAATFDRCAHDRFIAFRRTTMSRGTRVFQLGIGLAAWGEHGRCRYPMTICHVPTLDYEQKIRLRLDQEAEEAGPLKL